MNKVVISKKVDKDGFIDIVFCKGSTNEKTIWFQNETQYKAFVYLLTMLDDCGASSISISDEPDNEVEVPVNNEETPDSRDEVRDNGD